MEEDNNIQESETRPVTETEERQTQTTTTGIRWRSPVVGALVLLFGIALFLVIRLLATELAVIILGIAVAAALSPVESWLAQRMPRFVGILIIYGLLLLVVGVLIWFIFPAVVNQAQEIATQIPDWLDRLQNMYNLWDRVSDISISELIGGQLSGLSSSLITFPVTLASSLFQIVLILFISLYLLLDAPKIRQFFLSLFPEEKKEKTDEVTQGMVQAMGGFVRGVAIISFIIGVVVYLGLLIIGVNYPLILAVVAALLEVVPFIGPILASIPILLIAFLESPLTALITLIFVVVVQQLEGYVITPNVMHSQTEISPLLVLIAIMVGGAIGGVLWILAAIPLAAALRVLVRQVIAPWLRKILAAV